jgi:hypothetical protein
MCYDHYLLNNVQQQHMCVGCCNYNGVVLKKKVQIKMGLRFQCSGLLIPLQASTPNVNAGQTVAISATSSPCADYSDVSPYSIASDDSRCDTSTEENYSRCDTSAEENDPILALTSPPRKSVHESPMHRRIIRARNKPHQNNGRVS